MDAFFQRYDIDRLVALLHQEVVDVDAAVQLLAARPGQHAPVVPRAGDRLPRVARGGHHGQWLRRVRLIPDRHPAGGYAPFAIQVIEISDDRITGHHNFVDTDLFAPFAGLPRTTLILRPGGCRLSGQRTVRR